MSEERCANCQEILNGHKSVVDKHRQPQEGDLTVCLHCGAMYTFVLTGGQLGRRPATQAEINEVPADLMAMVKDTIRKYRRFQARGGGRKGQA